MTTAAVKSKNAKDKKKQEKIIAKKIKKGKLGLIPMVTIWVIIILISLKIINNLGAIGKNSDYIDVLEKEYNHLRINNEALQQKVEAPIDDEYMSEVAREIGYRDLDEDLYYLNEGE